MRSAILLKIFNLRLLACAFIIITMLLHARGDNHIGFFDQLEALAYDARIRFTATLAEEPKVIILDIDEHSLKVEGRWPWSRDKIARLVNGLFKEQKVSVVGFDMVFAEPDTSSGLPVLQAIAQDILYENKAYLETLAELEPHLNFDQQFAESLQGRNTVLGYYFTSSEPGKSVNINGALPKPTFSFIEFIDRDIPFISSNGYGGNLASFQQSALSGGHFNPLYDIDGVTRRIPMLIEHEGDYYESLSLAIVRAYLGKNIPLEPIYSAQDSENYAYLEWLKLGDFKIPVDEGVATLVPYHGRSGSFRYVSATDLLSGALAPAELEGKIIILGTSAPGLMDLRVTPVQNAYPGVEVHANMIQGIIDQSIKLQPAYVLGYEMLSILLIGIILATALPKLSPIASTSATLLLMGLLIYINLYFWQYQNLVLPISNFILLCGAIYIINILYGYFVESRAKQQITDLFGQYVPPKVVNTLSLSPDKVDMDGETREMTVLFSDVRDFTSISETLSAKELSQLMNAYLSRMTKVIQKHNGTIDKYIGDAIMAFWNAPLPDTNHPLNGVLAAIEMQRELDALGVEFEARGWPALRMGIGLNTGKMSVGNMGSSFRRSYTVMGDAVNLGARLESISKRYGAEVVISKQTMEASPELICRELDSIRVKGKVEPVTIYEAIGLAGKIPETTAHQLDNWKTLLQLYKNQQWNEAEVHLQKLEEQGENPTLIKLYKARIDHFQHVEPPSENWDGVYTYSDK